LYLLFVIFEFIYLLVWLPVNHRGTGTVDNVVCLQLHVMACEDRSVQLRWGAA